MGPFDIALHMIIYWAQDCRSDRDQQDLWRCGAMTASEIQNLKNKIGERVYLPGYTSCCLDKSRAMSFAWEDETTGHQKVFVHIKWKDEYCA